MEYDRQKMYWVLIYHQRASSANCACGGMKLGESHADHILDLYERGIDTEPRS